MLLLGLDSCYHLVGWGLEAVYSLYITKYTRRKLLKDYNIDLVVTTPFFNI